MRIKTSDTLTFAIKKFITVFTKTASKQVNSSASLIYKIPMGETLKSLTLPNQIPPNMRKRVGVRGQTMKEFIILQTDDE